MTHGWDVVRARNKDTGDHYTTTRHRATLRGDSILDRPATDKHGRWLDPTPHKTITPTRDTAGRFTPTEPAQGEEEA